MRRRIPVDQAAALRAEGLSWADVTGLLNAECRECWQAIAVASAVARERKIKNGQGGTLRSFEKMP